MFFGSKKAPKKQEDYGSSDEEDEDDDFCSRVDLLQSDELTPNKKGQLKPQTMAERQKIREKLQKRKKQQEVQKAQF